MLSVQTAEEILLDAVQRNPGPWEGHSRSAANNARRIAEHAADMDPDKAYVMGLLHDIGRREGFTGIRHIFDGYRFLMNMGENDIARICLSHSFPLKDADTFIGKYDCTVEELAFLRDFLKNTVYDDYDVLIQLCDAISLPNGACIMEKRLMDVALRHGIPPFARDKWKAFLDTKKYFDEKCGVNIYTLIDNVFENSCINL